MATSERIAAPRFHFGLKVTDIDRAVAFYEILLGVRAAKLVDDYAKFDVEDPPVVLTLHGGGAISSGALNHVGFRVGSSDALVAVQHRLEAHGIPTVREEGVECCYALQTKFWVTDADRNLWEVYTLEGDLDHSGFGGEDHEVPAIDGTAARPVVWEHALTSPPPVRIPFDDEAVDEVRLEGTYNADLAKCTRTVLVSEAFRVLRPGGRIKVHGLVSDRPYPGVPNLPGPAGMVRAIPIETLPAHELQQAGFVGLLHDKLGDIHCFQSSGVLLRELCLSGLKPWEYHKSQLRYVMYRGPLAEVVDERGQLFRKGIRTAVDEGTWKLLRRVPFCEEFTCFDSYHDDNKDQSP